MPPPAPLRAARAGGGRRTDPARGATGEVSSWGGTRGPLSGCGAGPGQAPVARVASSAVAAREAVRQQGTADARGTEGSAGTPTALRESAYSVAARRPLR